uniref:Uncharacterized protein n=1 Tax=Rhizophora mucronata TaxID=61149 RepID=A0A2P2PFX8_RHIMU
MRWIFCRCCKSHLKCLSLKHHNTIHLTK